MHARRHKERLCVWASAAQQWMRCQGRGGGQGQHPQCLRSVSAEALAQESSSRSSSRSREPSGK